METLSNTIQPRRPFRHRRRRAAAGSAAPTPEQNVLTGTILPYAGATVPPGYLECDGAAVSRAEYAALFEVIGTAYGAGDGGTTFNLPDFRSRAILGAGQGVGLSVRARGDTGGTERHALTLDELPGHSHDYVQATGISVSTQSVQTAMDQTVLQSESLESASPQTGGVGGGQAVEFIPPFGVARWMVKA